MKPVNNKSLTHCLFDLFEGVGDGTVTPEKARAQTSIAKEIHSGMRYENERVETLIKVDKYNREVGTEFVLRNVEGKPFDSLP
jgi:hypothetical protein